MVLSDDWTKCAMRDGEVVAELLVTLKEAKVIKNPTVAALRWGIRQPRSQPPRKEAESRCSPSTPLSWSGGSSFSPSGYVDGYEATSRRISSVGSKSKVLVTADLDFDVKRLQRKKDNALLRSPFSESEENEEEPAGIFEQQIIAYGLLDFGWRKMAEDTQKYQNL